VLFTGLHRSLNWFSLPADPILSLELVLGEGSQRMGYLYWNKGATKTQIILLNRHVLRGDISKAGLSKKEIL